MCVCGRYGIVTILIICTKIKPSKNNTLHNYFFMLMKDHKSTFKDPTVKVRIYLFVHIFFICAFWTDESSLFCIYMFMPNLLSVLNHPEFSV